MVFLKRIKYLVLIATVVCTSLLCGCDGSSPLDGENGLNFSDLSDANITVEHDGKVYDGKLCFTPEKVGSIKITGPEGVKDVVFSWENDKVKISRENLSIESDKPLLPSNSFIICIVSVLNALKDQENISEGLKDGDKYLIRGKCDCGKFEVVLGMNNSIEKIKIPEKDLEVIMDIE